MGEPLVAQALLVLQVREVLVDRPVLQVVGLLLKRPKCLVVNKLGQGEAAPLPVNLRVGEPLVARAVELRLRVVALLAGRAQPRAAALLLEQLRGRLV